MNSESWCGHATVIGPVWRVDPALVTGLVAAFLALGCGADESRPSRPVVQAPRARPPLQLIESVALIPEEPTSVDVLTAVVRVPGRAADEVEIEIDWVVNGAVFATSGPESQPPGQFGRGDRVFVVVRASDGRESASVASPEIVIRNAPPVIRSATVEPDVPTTMDAIVGDARCDDVDGDPIDYQWRWYRNGAPIADQVTEVLSPQIASKGDAIVGEVRAFDGYTHSGWVRTRNVVVQNSAPTIRIETNFVRGEDGVYRSSLKFEDPDGDVGLRIRLIRGPTGMDIDPVSGVLSWTPLAGAQESHLVEIMASDSEGAESTLNFTATIEPGVEEEAANGASDQ